MYDFFVSASLLKCFDKIVKAGMIGFWCRTYWLIKSLSSLPLGPQRPKFFWAAVAPAARPGHFDRFIP